MLMRTCDVHVIPAQCMHTCTCICVCLRVCVGGGGGEQGRHTGLELGQQEMDMVPRVDETDMTSSYQAGPAKNQDYRHHFAFLFFSPSCFCSLFLFFCYAVCFLFYPQLTPSLPVPVALFPIHFGEAVSNTSTIDWQVDSIAFHIHKFTRTASSLYK